MSIYFEFEVGKTGRRFRRAVECDKYEISSILKQDTAAVQLFGEVDIGALIELSVLSICMINKRKQVIGFIAVSDHPNVRGVDPAHWEYWIRNLFQRFYLSRNTLFVHLMCCVDSVLEYFFEDALISIFENDAYLNYIVLVFPGTVSDTLLRRHAVFKRRYFYKFMSKGGDEKVGSYLITANRQDFCPKLRMRRAVQEDNDDIVEILDKVCPRLKELYGSYYASEIIGQHPDIPRQILVGDIQGRAVSVICLNTDINYVNLQSTYELQPFNNLLAATPLEKEHNKRDNELRTIFADPILTGQWHPFSLSKDSYHQRVAEKAAKIDATQTSSKNSKVYFKKKASLRKSMDRVSVKHLASGDSDKLKCDDSPAVLQTLLTSTVINMLDEDSFDYDIVNIDKSLLSASAERPACSTIWFRKSTQSGQSVKKKLFKKFSMRRGKPTKVKAKETTAMSPAEQNAFMIELFAIRDDIDQRVAFDMLEAAFEIMKQFDYCIISLPTSGKHFNLLQHFCPALVTETSGRARIVDKIIYDLRIVTSVSSINQLITFLRFHKYVPAKQRICTENALYIAHRSAIMGRLRVREAEVIDIADMAKLLYPLEASTILKTVEETIINAGNTQAFVLTSGMTIVGVAVLEPPEEIDFLRSRFTIDMYQIHKYRYMTNGVHAGYANIRAIIVYPVFEVHHRFFAREIMRLSGNSTLIYMTAYRNKLMVHRGNALVSAMVPLMPRAFSLTMDRDAFPELKRIGEISDAIVPFNCWLIGTRITSMPKVNVTSRIVVVGASTTALGFLNTLLFDQSSTYLTFTNVTLVSLNGLPYQRRVHTAAESMFMRYKNTTNKYMKSVPYTYYLNVKQGQMAEINLQEKFITLTSGNRCNYDLLFLFFGKQYQHPNYMVHILEREKVYQSTPIPEYIPLDVPRFSDTEIQIASDETPYNVFIINHLSEASAALNYVNNYEPQPNEDVKIIVYGATIHAYLCIQALVSINVNPESIIFVEPFPPENPKKIRVPAFSNPDVDRTVTEVINKLKIKVYRSHYFQSWDVNLDNIVTHVDFMSYSQYLRLECSIFFYYGQRGINIGAFVAIHKSGLSFDGGVIIDQNCRTRDPSVYAAGPHTRYHRRYYAEEYAHKYFDLYEVGSKLGTQIRNQLDPLFSEGKCKSDKPHPGNPTSKDGTTRLAPDFEIPHLMELRKPKVTCCVLPGGFKYLDVRSPGKKLPHHYIHSLNYNGSVMETFKQGYFKLHLTKEFYVDGITCISLSNYSLEKFKLLYGLSSMVLKNVHLRYSTNQLDDFFKFFSAPWAGFLYHDNLDNLSAMAKELYPKHAGQTIKEALRRSIQDHPDAMIRDNFQKSPYVEVITEYVMDWLSRNDVLLPMYLQPWQRSDYAYDLDYSPLFNEKY